MPKGVYLHKPCSEETRVKISKALQGRPHTEEMKASMSLTMKGRPSPLKGRPSPLKGTHPSKETRAKMSLAKRGCKHPTSEETKIKIGKKAEARWQDPKYRDRVVKAWWLAQEVKPNKVEICLFELLESAYPGEWTYVGDGQLIIGGKCPDFTNINGKKQVIELYGDYWHRGEDPQVRIDLFRQYGFECLIIWEHELEQPEEVVNKVADFAKRKEANSARILG